MQRGHHPCAPKSFLECWCKGLFYRQPPSLVILMLPNVPQAYPEILDDDGGGSLHLCATQYLLRWFVFPICHTNVPALFPHYFKPVTCVYSVIFSLQRGIQGVGSLLETQDVFPPGTDNGTNDAHLVHMCWPVLWGLHQLGYSFATCVTYALMGSHKWIMRVLNSQGSWLWWLHHPSRFTCVLFACISGGYHSLP